MRIRTKFWGSALGVIGLTIGLSVGRAWLIQNASKAYLAERQQVGETSAAILDLELALQAEIAIATQILLNPQAGQAERVAQSEAVFIDTLTRLKGLISDWDSLTELRLQSVERRHQALARDIERLLQQTDGERDLSRQIRSLHIHEQEMGIFIYELLESSKHLQVEVIQDFQAFQQVVKWLEILGLSSIVMLLGVQFYGVFLPLLKTLNQLETGATAIGQGNLNHRLAIHTGDELAQLAATFNHMAAQLSQSYAGLEQVVAERTAALTAANDSLAQEVCDRASAEIQLKDTLAQLQRTQVQLIQTEKMSSLGQLVAGIAHEINNPMGFISSNLTPAAEYTETLMSLVHSYQQECPHQSAALQAQVEAADLPFIEYDMPRLLASMQNGVDRISQIVLSLRTFSRLDEADLKTIDVHRSLDNILMLLASRLRVSAQPPEIGIVKRYGDLPPVECYAGQLNQVLMNLLDNAIDALTHCSTIDPEKWCITLTTRRVKNAVQISIADNGPGIDPTVQPHIFDPFFTTKPVGHGTGLGLSTSYQIIAGMHQGRLWCDSQPGQGATFTMELPVESISSGGEAISPEGIVPV
ncbi:MAG: ATP-binding protein [Cyanobacteria bacterium P01_A01_bin.105]